jgi:protein-S-isoprenylcysteine O-methyltransferase Ste14
MTWGRAGVVLFAVSAGVFLYTYAFPFGVVREGSPAAVDVVMNAALFALFAGHHSLFARTPIRARVARTMPPPGERVLYVWIASLLLILLCAGWRPLDGVVWALRGWAAWGLYILQVGGVWLILRSAAVIDPRELTGLAAPAPGGPDFRRAGPYGRVRHPIYAGWLLLTCATPVMTMDRFVFGMLGAVYVLIAIRLEEGTLRRTGGAAYARYAAGVRWKLVPGIY